MRQAHNGLCVHIVWATWDRMPLLTAEVEARLYPAILDKCEERRCDVYAIGGVEDHVHLLVRLNPSVALADLVKHVKGASSHLATHDVMPDRFFQWQGSYAAFAVEDQNVAAVRQYVENQKEHHANRSVEKGWELSPVQQPWRDAGSI